MYCVKTIKDDLFWVGGSDRRLALFENAYPIPKGISYNSYVLLDEKKPFFLIPLTGPSPDSFWKMWKQFLAAGIWIISL